MRTQSNRLVIAALLLLAGAAALAAQATTIVGTIVAKTDSTLQVRTDSGLQMFSTAGLDLPTLAQGDMVRVSYTTQDDKMTASAVARVATITVTLPEQAGVETLIVDEVETGSLDSLAGLGDVKAKVMMSGNNRVTIRTADDNAPVVAIRTHLPKGVTNFQGGENILLRVPTPVIQNDMTVSTELVSPPVARVEPKPEAVVEPKPEPEPTVAEVRVDPKPVATPPAATANTYASNRLPQTASRLHLAGLVGLASLVGVFGLGLARRLW